MTLCVLNIHVFVCIADRREIFTVEKYDELIKASQNSVVIDRIGSIFHKAVSILIILPTVFTHVYKPPYFQDSFREKKIMYRTFTEKQEKKSREQIFFKIRQHCKFLSSLFITVVKITREI